MTTMTTAIRMSMSTPHWYPASHQPNPIPRHRTETGLEKRAECGYHGPFRSPPGPEKPMTWVRDGVARPSGLTEGHRSSPAHPRGNFGLVFCWQAPVGAAQTNVRAGRRHRTGPYRSPQRWCVRCSLSCSAVPLRAASASAAFRGASHSARACLAGRCPPAPDRVAREPSGHRFRLTFQALRRFPWPHPSVLCSQASPRLVTLCPPPTTTYRASRSRRTGRPWPGVEHSYALHRITCAYEAPLRHDGADFGCCPLRGPCGGHHRRPARGRA